MTLNEIAYSILLIYNGGKTSDDVSPPLEQIKFFIRYYRALFIRRDINKNTYRAPILFQSLGVLELERVDIVEDCSITLGCDILRTVNKIPSPIRLNDGEALRVFKLDGTSVITPIEYDMVNYLAGNKFTYSALHWFHRNERIYIVGGDKRKMVKYIRPFGIFEDPITASQLVECDDNPCLKDTDEYPLPSDMIQGITMAILTNELKYSLSTPQDDVNNANDSK